MTGSSFLKYFAPVTLAFAGLSATSASAQEAENLRPVAENFEQGERTYFGKHKIVRMEDGEEKRAKEKLYITYNGTVYAEDCAPMEHFTIESERKIRSEGSRRKKWTVVESREEYLPASLTPEIRQNVESCLQVNEAQATRQMQRDFRETAARQMVGTAMQVDNVQGVSRNNQGGVNLEVSIDFSNRPAPTGTSEQKTAAPQSPGS